MKLDRKLLHNAFRFGIGGVVEVKEHKGHGTFTRKSDIAPVIFPPSHTVHTVTFQIFFVKEYREKIYFFFERA